MDYTSPYSTHSIVDTQRMQLKNRSFELDIKQIIQMFSEYKPNRFQTKDNQMV